MEYLIKAELSDIVSVVLKELHPRDVMMLSCVCKYLHTLVWNTHVKRSIDTTCDVDVYRVNGLRYGRFTFRHEGEIAIGHDYGDEYKIRYKDRTVIHTRDVAIVYGKSRIDTYNHHDVKQSKGKRVKPIRSWYTTKAGFCVCYYDEMHSYCLRESMVIPKHVTVYYCSPVGIKSHVSYKLKP